MAILAIISSFISSFDCHYWLRHALFIHFLKGMLIGALFSFEKSGILPYSGVSFILEIHLFGLKKHDYSFHIYIWAEFQY